MEALRVSEGGITDLWWFLPAPSPARLAQSRADTKRQPLQTRLSPGSVAYGTENDVLATEEDGRLFPNAHAAVPARQTANRPMPRDRTRAASPLSSSSSDRSPAFLPLHRLRAPTLLVDELGRYWCSFCRISTMSHVRSRAAT